MPKKFTSDYQPSPEKRRVKKKKTVLREILGINNIEDLKADVLKVWANHIQSTDYEKQSFAAKEISKYIFPQKREHSGEINSAVKVQFININKPEPE